MKRRQRGFSLLEVIVAMTVLGVFLVIVFLLTAEMRGWERRLPVNFMRHPQVIAVISRLRRDMLDVRILPGGHIYLQTFKGYTNGSKTLIFQTLLETGVQTVVWDFSEPTVVRRISDNVGVESVWTARGLPEDFSATIDAVEFLPPIPPPHPFGVRLIAKDKYGNVAIDQILQPRTHE